MSTLSPVSDSAPSNALGRALDRAVFLGLLTLLLALPLPFGSHRPWAEYAFGAAVFSLLVMQSMAFAVSRVKLTRLDIGVGSMISLWVLWLAWVWAQTLPWPQSWLAWGSPQRWQHLQFAAGVLRTETLTMAPPSLDATLGRAQALLSSVYATLFLLLILSLRHRSRFEWLLWTLLISGIAQAAYGSLMVLSQLEYGAWGAKDAYRGFATGTFVNRNHFAGYMEICIGVALGLIVATPDRTRTLQTWRQRLLRLLTFLQEGRMFARASIALFFVALILSQSRMGNVSAVAGLCAASAALLLVRRSGNVVGGMLLVASILLVDIWLFGRWFGLDELAQRFATVDASMDGRLLIFRDVQKMIPEYFRVGSGLGTFALAYPQFRSPEILGFVDHAHNDYAQFLVETGVIGCALLGTMVIVTMGRAILILRRRRDPVARGISAAAIAAITALGVHSTADFNLQIPAVAATLVVLIAAVWACPTRSSRDHRYVRDTQVRE